MIQQPRYDKDRQTLVWTYNYKLILVLAILKLGSVKKQLLMYYTQALYKYTRIYKLYFLLFILY